MDAVGLALTVAFSDDADGDRVRVYPFMLELLGSNLQPDATAAPVPPKMLCSLRHGRSSAALVIPTLPVTCKSPC